MAITCFLQTRKKKKKRYFGSRHFGASSWAEGEASRAPPSGGAGTERLFYLFSAKRPKLLAQEYKHSQGLFIRVQICFQSFLGCRRGKLSHPSKATGRVFVGHWMCMVGEGTG